MAGLFICLNIRMNWTNLTRVVAPAPIFPDLDLVKLQTRIDYDDSDSLLSHFVEAATQYVDGPNGIGRALMTQTWRQSHDQFPRDGIVIELGPVQSIESITYIDAEGVQQTLDPAAYVYDLDAAPVTILPAPGTCFPHARHQPGSIKVTFVAGYGDAEDVPADLKQAILYLVAHYAENREAVVGTEYSITPFELPLGVEAILNRYRFASFI